MKFIYQLFRGYRFRLFNSLFKQRRVFVKGSEYWLEYTNGISIPIAEKEEE